MKFKDIDIEEDYFGYGELNDKTVIFKHNDYTRSFSSFKLVNGEMILDKNKIDYHCINFRTDHILDKKWFKLVFISKYDLRLGKIEHLWETWL